MPRTRDFCFLSARQRRRIVKTECINVTQKTGFQLTQMLQCGPSTLQAGCNITASTSTSNEDYVTTNASLAQGLEPAPLDSVEFEADSDECGEDSTSFTEDNRADFMDENEPLLLRPASSNCTLRLQDRLGSWVSKHAISHSATTELLNILNSTSSHEEFKSLPNDARTLMGTPRNMKPLEEYNGGKYVHFGLVEQLSRQLKKYSLDIEDTEVVLKININIDGLPISKSSGGQLWPILASLVLDNVYTDPFPLGIFYGLSKPTDTNLFLEPFVQDVLTFPQNNTLHDTTIILRVNALICDAPAHAMIAGIKHHSGYFGCPKCICEGGFIENRVTFPDLNCILRTDDSFQRRTQPEHHRHDSVLETLQIGMVSQFPLDYMHLVLLGVTKRLLQFWVKGKMDVRLKGDQLENVSQLHILLRKYISSEFVRLPRSLREVDRWKATEFRLFLLYTGVVLLEGVLNRRFYKHFLCLSVAIRILVDNDLCITLNDYANDLLVYFVRKFSVLYGAEHISYNVHNLIHLAREVRTYGPLDSFSAFKYENFINITLFTHGAFSYMYYTVLTINIYTNTQGLSGDRTR